MFSYLFFFFFTVAASISSFSSMGISGRCLVAFDLFLHMLNTFIMYYITHHTSAFYVNFRRKTNFCLLLEWAHRERHTVTLEIDWLLKTTKSCLTARCDLNRLWPEWAASNHSSGYKVEFHWFTVRNGVQRGDRLEVQRHVWGWAWKPYSNFSKCFLYSYNFWLKKEK